MYFLQQIKWQYISNIIASIETAEGPGDTPESSNPTLEGPEEKQLAELETQSGVISEPDLRVASGEEELKNAEARAGTDTLEESAGGDGLIEKGETQSSPEAVLQEVPASNAERLAAEAAVIAAGGDIADESLVQAAVVSERGEKPGEIRELSLKEQETVKEGLLAGFAPDIGIDAETLSSLYAFNAEVNPEFNPETIGTDMENFANEMEKLQILTEKMDNLQMPTNQEEYNALMSQLEQFRGSDGTLEIPLTAEEIEEMGITVDLDGNITIPNGTTYSSSDVPPGMPHTNEGGQMVSGYRGGAREGGRSYGYESDIDVNNLPKGVEGLMAYIVYEEAGGSYDRLYNGTRITPPNPITQMKVGEVRSFQDQMVREQNARGINPASSAIGGLQIIRPTLDGLISAGVVSKNDIFNKATQNKLMLALLVEDGLDRYREGSMSKAGFMKNISGTWASFPADASGRGSYDGDAIGNRAYADASVVDRLLNEIAENSTGETPTA